MLGENGDNSYNSLELSLVELEILPSISRHKEVIKCQWLNTVGVNFYSFNSSTKGFLAEFLQRWFRDPGSFCLVMAGGFHLNPWNPAGHQHGENPWEVLVDPASPTSLQRALLYGCTKTQRSRETCPALGSYFPVTIIHWERTHFSVSSELTSSQEVWAQEI